MYIAPMMPKVPPSATAEDRLILFFDWCELNSKMNPSLNLPLGIEKKWYHFFKSEHPFTTKYKHPDHYQQEK